MDPEDRLKKEIFEAITNIANNAIENSDGIEDHTSEYEHDDFITRYDIDEFVTEDNIRDLIRDDPDLVSKSEFNLQIEKFDLRIEKLENEKLPGFHLDPDWISSVNQNILNLQTRVNTLRNDKDKLLGALQVIALLLPEKEE